MVIGTIALVGAVWALFRGASPKLRIPNRKIAGWILAGSLAVGATGSALAPPEKSDTKVITSGGIGTAGVIPSDPKSDGTTTTAKPTTTTAKPATTTTMKSTTTTRPPTTTTTRRITTTTVPARSGNCDPSYPDVCIPSGPDLDCQEIPYTNFRVIGTDPHRFDADHDGIGCEKN